MQHLLVNDEQATKGNAVGGQHIVLLHNLALQVRDKGVCQVTHSSLVAVCTRQKLSVIASLFVYLMRPIAPSGPRYKRGSLGKVDIVGQHKAPFR